MPPLPTLTPAPPFLPGPGPLPREVIMPPEMASETELCRCGRPVTIVISSGAYRVALCDRCYQAKTRRLLADLKKRKLPAP